MSRVFCGRCGKKVVAAAAILNPDDPLEFIVNRGGVSTILEAAYRFCRHEPGVHVVLTGTGNPDHLKANVEAITKPPLSKPVPRRLAEVFGNVDWLSGN